jgi:hypothetical protein
MQSFFMQIQFILFCFLVVSNTLKAQTQQWLKASYVQEKYKDEVLIERLGGFLTYDFQSVKVVNEKPIYQITQVLGNRMQIYYPQDAKAFEMSAQKPFDYPIVSNLTPLMNENYGLEELGFSIDSVYVKGDSTYTRWISTQKEQDNPIQFELVFVSQTLVTMRMQNSAATFTMTSYFSQYTTVGTYSLPQKIESLKKVKEEVSKEVFYFSNFSLVNAIESIKPIVFPDSVDVKSYRY